MDSDISATPPPTKGSSHKLFRFTSIVALMTLLSRILGFARDVVIAILFGAGPAFDAFVIAFKIPNFMRRLFAEGAFSQAFVPVLAEYHETQKIEHVKAFIGRMAGTLGLILLLVVIAAEIAAPIVITIFAPGFVDDPTRFHNATQMLHITFPYIFLIALTAFSGAILNTLNRFTIPAFTPVLLNVALILAAWLLAPHLQHAIYALAWGVLAGGILQLTLQLIGLKRVAMLYKPTLGFQDPGVRKVLKLMIPALYDVSVAQLSLLIDNFFASFLPKGSISWLYYSDRLTYLPLGVIGVALATVVLPNLSRQRHHNDNNYSNTLNWALRIVVLIGVPAAIGLLILAGPVITTLFYYGAFNAYDVLMTRRSLWAFSIGLPAFMLIKLLASAFYSQQDIKTPVKVATVAMVTNLLLNLALIHPLAHAGLALATSLAAMLNAALLFIFLLKRRVFILNRGWMIFLFRLIVANIMMALAIIWATQQLSTWLTWSIGNRIWHLLLVILFGVLTYTVTLLILGLRPNHLRLKWGE